MLVAAFIVLLLSNAAALFLAEHYRKRINGLIAIAYALTPDHDQPVTFWPCDCRHLLLWERVQTKICCDTLHAGDRCQPIPETI